MLWDVTVNDTVVHGACIGADELCAEIAADAGARVVAIVPPDRRLVSRRAISLSDEVIEIPSGPDGFKRRNQAIVDMVDRLLGFPLYPEDHPMSRRSGTWQTIRMGRRKGIPVHVEVVIP